MPQNGYDGDPPGASDPPGGNGDMWDGSQRQRDFPVSDRPQPSRPDNGPGAPTPPSRDITWFDNPLPQNELHKRTGWREPQPQKDFITSIAHGVYDGIVGVVDAIAGVVDPFGIVSGAGNLAAEVYDSGIQALGIAGVTPDVSPMDAVQNAVGGWRESVGNLTTGGAVGGAIVGGMVAGPAGAALGAGWGAQKANTGKYGSGTAMWGESGAQGNPQLQSSLRSGRARVAPGTQTTSEDGTRTDSFESTAKKGDGFFDGFWGSFGTAMGTAVPSALASAWSARSQEKAARDTENRAAERADLSGKTTGGNRNRGY